MATILTSYATYKSEDVKAALESARDQYKTECVNEESSADPECDDLDKILTDDRLSRYLPPGTRAGTMTTVNETGYYPLVVIDKGADETIIQPDGRQYSRSVTPGAHLPQVTMRSPTTCVSKTAECSKDDVLFANILSAAMYIDFNQSAFISRDDLFKYSATVRHATYWLQSHQSEKQTRFYLHDN